METQRTAEQLAEEARKLGKDYGHAAGSWVIDGNTTADICRWVIQAIDNGDPEFDIPAPLSGEWAGDPTPASVFAELEVEDDGEGRFDYLLDAYEEAYYMAYEDEAYRSAVAMLPEEES